MTVDMGRTPLMEKYLDARVRDEADLAAVIYAVRVTAWLYADMLWSAIQHVDQ
jgi:hypothetical protein